jgi:putative peptidoglycan lipid II flippase
LGSQPVQRSSRTSGEGAGLIRGSAAVAIGTAASRLTGFAALAILAYILGFSRLTDTYNLANTTPNMVYDLLLGGILSATLVPLFVEHLARSDREADTAVISAAVMALLFLTVVAVLAVPAIVRLYTLDAGGPGGHEQRAVARSLLRLLMPQVFLYGVAGLFTALLQARQRFVAAAFAPAVANVARIALFLVVGWMSGPTPDLHRAAGDDGLVLLLGLGTTMTLGAMILCLVPSLFHAGIRVAWGPAWKHPVVRRVLRMSGWTLGYVAVNQLALLVVLVLANRHAGGIAAYQGAFTFFQLPHGLVAVSLMTTIAPELARRAVAGDLAGYRARFSGGLRLLWLATIPAAAGYLVLAAPVVTVLLQHGALTESSGVLTAHMLMAFAVGLPGFSLYLYALRGFYALGDTRTPFLLAALENAINIAVAFALERRMGAVGLPLSYAIAYLATSCVALAALRRRVGPLIDSRTASVLYRTLVGAGLMALAVHVARSAAASINLPTQLGIGLLVGGTIYFSAILTFMRTEWLEVRAALRSDRRR